MKICARCKEEKELSEFYELTKTNGTKYLGSYCKECTSLNHKKYYKQSREIEDIFLKIPPEPNTFENEKQKEIVFEFLVALGWSFNESNGIWWKEGIKDSTGTFPKIEEFKLKKKEERNKKRREKRKENKKDKNWSRKRNDYIGEKYNHLTIIEELESIGKVRVFLCECDCGKTKNVRLTNLISNNTKSCGCGGNINKEKSTNN